MDECESIYLGFPTRMVYLYYISCLRYTIQAGNPRYVGVCVRYSHSHWQEAACSLSFQTPGQMPCFFFQVFSFEVNTETQFCLFCKISLFCCPGCCRLNSYGYKLKTFQPLLIVPETDAKRFSSIIPTAEIEQGMLYVCVCEREREREYMCVLYLEFIMVIQIVLTEDCFVSLGYENVCLITVMLPRMPD